MVIFAVVVVSHADWYLKTDWWRKHSTNWAIHKPGPMLRRLTEVIRGTELDVSSSDDEWGIANAGDTLGPDVIEYHGAKLFDLGKGLPLT